MEGTRELAVLSVWSRIGTSAMHGFSRGHPSARGFPYTWIAASTTKAPPLPGLSHGGSIKSVLGDCLG